MAKLLSQDDLLRMQELTAQMTKQKIMVQNLDTVNSMLSSQYVDQKCVLTIGVKGQDQVAKTPVSKTIEMHLSTDLLRKIIELGIKEKMKDIKKLGFDPNSVLGIVE